MISKRTVLVLGAGASFDAGFPTGRGLVDEVGKAIQKVQGRGPGLRLRGEELAGLREFGTALQNSACRSVDRFVELSVENSPEHLPLAKLATALALIPVEAPSRLFGSDTRFVRPEKPIWYELLLDSLTAPLGAFKGNRLSIVTFNYDRSLEYYLQTAIQYRYSIPHNEAVSLAKAIPITHIYGDLGDPYDDTSVDYRPYEVDVDRAKLEIACRRLRLIPEERRNAGSTPSHSALIAQDCLQGAQRIYFIGFAFDHDNLERIRPQEFSRTPEIYLSTYGESESRIAEIEGNLHEWVGTGNTTKFNHAPPTLNAYQFLKHAPSLDKP